MEATEKHGFLRFAFDGEQDYEKIKIELEPLIMNITKDKAAPSYRRFQKIVHEWRKRYHRLMKLSAQVESIQELLIPRMQEWQTKENRRLFAVVNLFRYLGLVESIGTSIIDMLVLLLMANGRKFREATLDDLEYIRLADKIDFLHDNKLEETSKLVDRPLRNDIAHLDFDIDEEGKISTGNYENLNINEKVNTFNRYFIMITFVLADL